MAKELRTPEIDDPYGESAILLRKLIDQLLEIDDDALFGQLLDLERQREEHTIDRVEYDSSLEDLYTKANSIEKPNPEQELAILTEGLEKRYKNFVLGPIDLELYTGQMVGLVGENGNGKTTLLRMIAQDLSSTSGHIEYPLLKYSNQYTLRSHIPYIPQRTPKWYGAVKDNLVFCALMYGISKDRVDLYVEIWMLRFGIWHFRHHTWEALSSGYKMRFELVRAFLRNPQVLVIDEPLANLDVLAQQLILEDLSMLVKSARYPKGIILSSQQLYNVESTADRVIFLKNGQVQNLQVSKDTSTPVYVIEIESNSTNYMIEEVLSSLGEVSIEGQSKSKIVYIEGEGIDRNKILLRLLSTGVDLNYFRDITQSTRRLFSNLNSDNA